MDLWLIKTADWKQQTRKRRCRRPRSRLKATRKQGSEVGCWRRRLNKVSVPSRWGGGVIARVFGLQKVSVLASTGQKEEITA